MSVAAHTLYEKSHPFLLPGPGGTLDLSHCRYQQVTSRRVRVSGSRFSPSNPYTLKLEGAKKIGYRTIFIGGVRDPIFIGAIDGVLKAVKDHVHEFFADVPPDTYQLIFHVYGKNGVMGELEPLRNPSPHELCVIGEVAAASQDLATAICGRARTALLHAPYPGKMATAGNLGLPFTPLEIPLGEVCQFNVYHLMEVDSPTELFPIKPLEIWPMTAGVPLRDIEKVVRSKNAGPFEFPFDIIFKTKEDYEAVKATGIITKELISKLYDVPTQQIVTFLYFDPAVAVARQYRRDRHACRPAACAVDGSVDPVAWIGRGWLRCQCARENQPSRSGCGACCERLQSTASANRVVSSAV